MEPFQLRDPELARDYILESLLLARAQTITADAVGFALRLAMEITSDGSPLPPVGLVLDIATAATRDTNERTQPLDVPGFDAGLARRYEDYVLGKFFADSSFERACDAIARYKDRDKDRAIAYVVSQIATRAEIGGAILSPAVIKGLSQTDPEEVLAEAQQSVASQGLSEAMLEDYRDLVSCIQSTGELLGTEDVFELEHGTALDEFGQRIALRQVLKAATLLTQNLPNQKPRARTRSYDVATNILEEDFYPVGGFSSISNRGTIESLVRSELAYIDKDVRPDLFDIKFARGELLYYSRDENQFLRRRLTFGFILHPALTQSRFKDPQLPYQRIIFVLAMLYAGVHRLSQWLSDEAIQFRMVFVKAEGVKALDDERALVETLLREQIESGVVEVLELAPSEVTDYFDELARTSLCQCASISPDLETVDSPLALLSHLTLNDLSPTLTLDEETSFVSTEADVDIWRETLLELLRFWI